MWYKGEIAYNKADKLAPVRANYGNPIAETVFEKDGNPDDKNADKRDR